MVRRLGLPALVVVLAACSLPARDNPVDPTIAPRVSMRVVGLPAGVTACGVPSGWTDVSAASPARCLALDARATYSPRDAQLERYDFAWVDSNGEAHLFSPALVSPTSGLAVLDADWLRGRTPQSVQGFRVTVYDDAGAWNDAGASFFLQNSAPIALGDHARSLPIGGYPWAPASQIDVTFDATASYDPDGDDPMKWCWTFPDGESCILPPGPPILHRTVDLTTRSRLGGELRVYDSHGPSLPVPVSVSVDDPVVWTQTESASARIERFDPQMRSYQPGTGSWFGGDLLNGTNRRFAFAQNNNGINPAALELLSPAGTFTSYGLTDTQTTAVASDGATMWLATFSTPGVGQPRHLQQWDLSADGSALVKGQTVTLATGLVPLGLEVDATHRVWIAYGGSAGVAVVSGGAATSAIVPTSYSTFALTARPGTSEVWAIDAPPYYDTTDTEELVVFDDPQQLPKVYLLPDSRAATLAWTDAGHLWIGRTGESVREIDVARFVDDHDTLQLDPATCLDDATLLEVPMIPSVSRLQPDPATGEIWGQTSGQVCFRLDELGDFQDGIPCFGGSLDAVDADGLFMIDRTPVVRIAVSPASDGVMTRLPQIGQIASGQADFEDGGVWKYVSEIPAFVLFAPDGSVRRTITKFRTDATTVIPFPRVYSSGWRVDADQSHIWLEEQDASFAYQGVRRYDLRQDPPIADPPGFLGVPPVTAQPELGPSLTGMGKIWIRQNRIGVEDDYGLLSTDGTITVRLAAPANFNQALWARSPRTNALCVGYESGAPGTATLYLLDPVNAGSGGTPLGSASVFLIQGIDAVPDPGGDVCAILFSPAAPAACPSIGTTMLQGWNAGGTMVLNQSFASSVPFGGNGFRGDSLTDLWLQVTSCTNGQHIETMHVSKGHQEHIVTNTGGGSNTSAAIGFAPR